MIEPMAVVETRLLLPLCNCLAAGGLAQKPTGVVFELLWVLGLELQTRRGSLTSPQ